MYPLTPRLMYRHLTPINSFYLLGLSLMLLGGCVVSDPPSDEEEETLGGAEGSIFRPVIGGMNTGPIGENTSLGGSPMSGGTSSVREGCMVGESLGLCSICGPDLTPKKPTRDPNCPFIDCESLSIYAITELEDGGQRCDRFGRTPKDENCDSVGVCVSDPQSACRMDEPLELFTAYSGCSTFEGCDGTEPPTTSIQPEGEICHGFGTCQSDGLCDAPSSCTDREVVPGNQLCGGDDQGCEIYVSARNYSNIQNISCAGFCLRGSRMGRCESAWSANSSDPCNKGDIIGCGENRTEVICRCSPTP